jgi:hypothetical protein
MSYILRAVGRSENPGVPVVFGGYNLPPLVEIGLTDLPKFRGGTPGTPRDNRPGLLTWLSVCVLTIWYFRPFGNAGLQSPRDLPSP